MIENKGSWRGITSNAFEGFPGAKIVSHHWWFYFCPKVRVFGSKWLGLPVFMGLFFYQMWKWRREIRVELRERKHHQRECQAIACQLLKVEWR